MTVLAQLPRVPPSRIALRVTPDARRRLRAGHPWLYDRSIRSASRDGAAGDLGVVFDDEHGVPLVAQLTQDIDETQVVARVEPDGRLIQDVQRIDE